MANNYVDNEEMYKELVEYKSLYNEWLKDNSKDKPTPSDSLAKKIELISINYSKKGNFVGYTWRKDMIQEAIHTCLKYLYNFNTEKYFNPFAYFTLVIHRSFLTYIKKQNKHSKMKDELYNNYDNSDNMTFGGFNAIDYTNLKSLKNISNIKCYMCGYKWRGDKNNKYNKCPKCNDTRVYELLQNPIKIMCNNCGYEWEEDLDKNINYCPKCESKKLYKPKKIKKIKKHK